MTFLPGLGGGGGPAVDNLFMKWNGEDVSQFEGSPAFIPAGWSAPTLSVVADATAPSGFILRLEVTATAGVGTLVWLLNTTPVWEPSGNDNRSFVFEMETTISSSSISIGPAFLCDDVGNFHGYGVSDSSGNSTIGRIDDGVEAAVCTGGPTTLGPAVWRSFVNAGKQAGAPPTWIRNCIVHGTGGAVGVRDTQADIGGAPGASWNNLACDRLGLVVIANLAATLQFDFRALNFSLLKQAA